MLEKYLPLLIKELEIDTDLATANPGVYSWPINEQVNVTLTSYPFGFSLSCPIDTNQRKEEELFFTQVMLGNLFGQGTEGAVLGLNEEGNLLTLTQTIDYTIDYKEFKDILEDFINTVEYWKDESKNYK